MKMKQQNLNLNNQFRKVYKRGKSDISPMLVVYYLKNNLGYHRVGITTSKKIGNAVRRNRARRVIREAFRQLQGEHPQLRTPQQGLDIVFVARTKATRVKMDQLKKVMERQLKNGRIL